LQIYSATNKPFQNPLISRSKPKKAVRNYPAALLTYFAALSLSIAGFTSVLKYQELL
jgi:hypothetical protein